MEFSDPIRGASEPDRLWTLTNVGEATPLVLSPICWSVWSVGVELGGRGALADLGVLSTSDVRVSSDPNRLLTACFLGRQAMNVDLSRQFAGTMPGMTGDDLERDLLGSVRPDAIPTHSRPARWPIMFAKAVRTLSGQRGATGRLHDEQLNWWRTTVLGADTADAGELMTDSLVRFVWAMRVHVRIRLVLNGVRSKVVQIAADAGKSELVGALLAGYGGVTEAALADDVWALGNKLLPMDVFLSRHGFHGPNEGNLIGHSWREDPEAVERAGAAHRGRPEADRPSRRVARAVAARETAEMELLADVPVHRRALVGWLLRITGDQVRALEFSKASFLMAVDGCRLAANTLGQKHVAARTLRSVDDVFYLTVDELLKPLPVNVQAVIDFRRERRDLYRRIEVPTVFTGMPEIEEDPADRDELDQAVHGIPAGPGVVEGTVRVVLESDADEPFEDGEVLVCRTVDPGWTALVSLAAALITDVGSPASHGAIVARELGITCVVGTGNGTRVLHTGDRVRVDGSSGEVSVLARAVPKDPALKGNSE